LDSTSIDLCLSVFWRAKFRKRKGGIKLLTLYNVKTSIPSFLHISNANVHDVNILDIIPIEAGSFYVVDKGYLDFKRLHRIHRQGSFFATRAKNNLRFQRMYSQTVYVSTGVIYDQIGKLEVYYSKKDYPDKLRRIKYFNEGRKKELVFLTNNTDLSAKEIAQLYKKCWEVEIFFQVDEAAFENQILVGYDYKCS
jgi:IS4 transposase